jgi:hypothetical protein
LVESRLSSGLDTGHFARALSNQPGVDRVDRWMVEAWEDGGCWPPVEVFLAALRLAPPGLLERLIEETGQ